MNKFIIWRVLIAIIGLIIFVHSGATSLAEMRHYYSQANNALARNDFKQVEQLLPSIKNYPLYPYIEYQLMEKTINTLSLADVNRFIATHPTFPFIPRLRSKFLNELIQRQDWKNVIIFTEQNNEKNEREQCQHYYAKWQIGERQQAVIAAKKIWLTGQSAAKECDDLFKVLKMSGSITPEMILERIELAAKANNIKLMCYLSDQLPKNYHTLKQSLTLLQKDPANVVSFAKTIKPTTFSHKIIESSFRQFARQDPVGALTALPIIVTAQKMKHAESLVLKESIAHYLMNSDVTPVQAKWRDNIVLISHNESLIERRIRLAISMNRLRSLTTWINRLPHASQQKDEWLYWRAMALQKNGDKKESRALLHQLMQQRGFYGMAAAQKLKLPYQVKVVRSAMPTRELLARPELARVQEFLYWQQEIDARREWRNLVDHVNKEDKQALAKYAYQKKWADLSVQATIIGKLWDHLEERFPIGWHADYLTELKQKNIALSYALAITRQESAWNPAAISPAGAMGLMQVMPKTAQATAKKFNITQYKDKRQLLEPRINIKIGTAYLDQMYQSFSNNRILSSAAYNAGPGRVKNWLQKSNGQLDAIAFIETIPFNETRNYVKNVLAYDAFYRYFMGESHVLFNRLEWQTRY